MCVIDEITPLAERTGDSLSICVHWWFDDSSDPARRAGPTLLPLLQRIGKHSVGSVSRSGDRATTEENELRNTQNRHKKHEETPKGNV